MPLIRRVKVDADFDAVPLHGLAQVVRLFAERLSEGGGTYEIIAHDRRDAAAIYEVMLAQVARLGVTGGRVLAHNCPHVMGFEEPTWVACTHAQYGYIEEAF